MLCAVPEGSAVTATPSPARRSLSGIGAFEPVPVTRVMVVPDTMRKVYTVPFGTWKRLSVLSALDSEGVLATMSIAEATDGDIFAAYLEQVLLPVLRERKPDAVLVMDNLRPHKTPEVQAVLEGSGFPYRYLPSDSPDLSPIEPGWAKVKAYLRRVAARTVEALQQALAPALDSITAQDAAGFFRHCGYACPN